MLAERVSCVSVDVSDAALLRWTGVVPDIMTSAKGLTGSFLPMALVGVRQEIKQPSKATPWPSATMSSTFTWTNDRHT